MIRLIRYEFIKQFCKRSILALFVVFSLANLFKIYGEYKSYSYLTDGNGARSWHTLHWQLYEEVIDRAALPLLIDRSPFPIERGALPRSICHLLRPAAVLIGILHRLHKILVQQVPVAIQVPGHRVGVIGGCACGHIRCGLHKRLINRKQAFDLLRGDFTLAITI